MVVNEVVVASIGSVTAIGHNCSELQTSLRNGYQNFRLVETGPSGGYIEAAPNAVPFLERVESFNVAPEIKSKARKLGNRGSASRQSAILSTLEAWQDCPLLNGLDPCSIGLVVAGHNLNQQTVFDTYKKYARQPEYLQPSYAQQFLDTHLLGVLSDIFNIRGEGFLVGAASASGNAALIQATRLIRHGVLDACVVVGAMAELSPVEIRGMQLIGAIGGASFNENPNGACRPFDVRHEGFVYGKGSGCVILLSERVAASSGTSYWAQVKGEAMCLDANSSTNPSRENEAAVMKKAIGRAGLNNNAIGYINTHGSSSPLGDDTELAAIQDLFGSGATPYLNSTKSLTGHCLWSAGIVEAIAVCIQLSQGFLHPDPNLEEPVSPQANWVGRQAQAAAVKTALSNSFGFGGINTSIVFEKGNKLQ